VRHTAVRQVPRVGILIGELAKDAGKDAPEAS